MIAQIIPLRRTPINLPFFDYLVPVELEGRVRIGQLVSIPLRTHTEYGVIKSILDQTKLNTKLKSFTEIILEHPIISAEHLKFLIEMSELYHVPLGFVVKSNLPELPKKNPLPAGEVQVRDKKIGRFEKPSLIIYQDRKERNQKIKNFFTTATGQVLILVPEIDDIKNIFDSLNASDQNKTAIIHSELKVTEYREAWQKIWLGKKQIIIGTRQALFLSFANLDQIIVDNEGHPSHKSWDMAPRFNTRDASLMLAKHENATLTFLTHTPTAETYFFAIKNIYQTTETPLPKILTQPYHLVDITAEKIGKNFYALSNEAQERINDTAGKTFLFLNKLGTAHFSACRDCGFVFTCTNCKRTINYSEKNRTLHCNWCKTESNAPLTCPRCQGANVFMTGAGTEKLEKEVCALFKNRPIIRLDKTTGTKKITNIPTNAIIVGTQHAWTRINWSDIVTMVFVDADAPLYSPEYKSTENLWQQLHDAAAKLPTQSEIYIQTRTVEHSIFQGLVQPEMWYIQELNNRKLFNYPPFSFIVKCYGSAPSIDQISHEAGQIYGSLVKLTKTHPDITITPNLELFPYFQKNAYWQVIIAKVSYRNYKQVTREIVKLLPDKWKVDLNPNTLLN